LFTKEVQPTPQHAPFPKNTACDPREHRQFVNASPRLSVAKTCAVLKQGFGLSLSSGGLSQLLQRVAGKLQGQYQELHERIRTSDAVYADETSWYVGCPGYWLWVFTTPTSTVYRIAGSRGHPVAAKVLGRDFAGVLVSDSAKVYDAFPGPQHKCIAHHLRNLEQRRYYPGQRSPHYLEAWELLWKDVLELTHARQQLAGNEFAARRAQLESRADSLLQAQPAEPGDRKFRTRMNNARKHLFGCLYHDVDPTNNRAERALRPAVVARKISCGNKTERGSRATEILLSLITTAHQQARDFLADLTQTLPLAALPAREAPTVARKRKRGATRSEKLDTNVRRSREICRFDFRSRC